MVHENPDLEFARQAQEVVTFWEKAGPDAWFTKDADFDARFRERFLNLHESAAERVRGASSDGSQPIQLDALGGWLESPESALALCLLLDQFPRNCFRDTPRMYATDALARRVADATIRAGHDLALPVELAIFVYLPFAHSEDLADQERSVELTRRLGQPHLSHAEGHREIVRRFGCFPHRNAILGRPTSAEQREFLAAGGFAG